MATQAARAGRLELADIVRAHADQLDGLSAGQRRVLQAIAQCRTATLGGHRRQCEACGHEEISYNSCRDRHCPKCQGLDEARWVEAQQRELLPVQYFHIVFTVPTELHPLFLTAPSVAYKLLFMAAAKTLEEVAHRRLGATIGFTAVLHTWTQLLLYHPHIHCIVPGGGLDPEETRWVPARRDFFLPVRVLSEVFRGKLLSLLEKALDRGKIRGGPDENPRRLLKRAARKKWVVYSKPPFAGPQQVLAYLGRYAYRIALSNDRLVGLQNGQVTFRWKDRAHGNAPRLATLDAEAFLRRFLLHVLPRRFVRIRHYGFLANSVRQERLPKVRELLGQPAAAPRSQAPKEPEPWEAMVLRLTGKDVTRCPRCGVGHLLVVEELPALSVAWDLTHRARSP
ncbi:MAG: IS91 family transposase [Elusimicrobia bacterium]|nr:IS91 family transposase [Elusimicrobiota bacterium]